MKMLRKFITAILVVSTLLSTTVLANQASIPYMYQPFYWGVAQPAYPNSIQGYDIAGIPNTNANSYVGQTTDVTAEYKNKIAAGINFTPTAANGLIFTANVFFYLQAGILPGTYKVTVLANPNSYQQQFYTTIIQVTSSLATAVPTDIVAVIGTLNPDNTLTKIPFYNPTVTKVERIN